MNEELRGSQALERLLKLDGVRTILDIGSGTEAHAEIMRAAGKEVFTISLTPGADHVGDFMAWADPIGFDAIWACHVLEHHVNPGDFLRKCRAHLRPGGVLAVTVPPLKHEIVGGHVTLWNAGLLLYQLIAAGFDCRNARVGTYGYNISALVENTPADLPELARDTGDIMKLAKFFPVPVREGFDGRLPDIGWGAPRVLQHEAGPVPRRVAILGLGPSVDKFSLLSRKAGGQHVICDEVWSINAIGDVFNSDRVFHMDDVRIQEVRAATAPASNIAEMLAWMKKHPGPIYTSRANTAYPGLVEFPLEEVINGVPQGYFNSTAAYAVAYAVHIGVEKILCFGMDFTYPNAEDAEKGRACVEFWLGVAAARGMQIALPNTTTLLDAMCPAGERFYGYDCVDLAFTRQGNRITVSMAEKAALPSAEEIEHRYDHDRHPNQLVEQHLEAAQ